MVFQFFDEIVAGHGRHVAYYEKLVDMRYFWTYEILQAWPESFGSNYNLGSWTYEILQAWPESFGSNYNHGSSTYEILQAWPESFGSN